MPIRVAVTCRWSARRALGIGCVDRATICDIEALASCGGGRPLRQYTTYLLPLASALSLFAQAAAVNSAQTCAIRGIVRAMGSGAPLADAEISVTREDSSDLPLLVLTDAHGAYCVDDLRPGNYSVVAEREGYVPRLFGQRGRSNKGIVLPLAPGKRFDAVDFELLSTGVIAGHVFGVDGHPRIGADVQAFTPRYVEGERRLMAADTPTPTTSANIGCTALHRGVITSALRNRRVTKRKVPQGHSARGTVQPNSLSKC